MLFKLKRAWWIVALMAGQTCFGSVPSEAETNAAPSPRDIVEMGEALPTDGINELQPIQIGGIKQWISIRGARKENPILLFLHGGPGWPMMPLSWTFQRPWEDYFTVVQWDQRGAGKTEASNPNAPPPSLDQMKSDTVELVAYLRNRFNRKKIFVIGHSWGSILGVYLAQQHPEWLYAYIGAGQVVNGYQNEAVGYRLVLKQAEAQKNSLAIADLERLAPYPRSDAAVTHELLIRERHWDVAFHGMRFGRDMEDDETIASLSPDYSEADVKAFSRGANLSEKVLWPAVEATDFLKTTNFKCPVVLFVGRHDMTTPAELAETWFGTLHAPSKKLVLLDQSAHMVFDEQPGTVLAHLIEDVAPLAQP